MFRVFYSSRPVLTEKKNVFFFSAQWLTTKNIHTYHTYHQVGIYTNIDYCFVGKSSLKREKIEKNWKIHWRRTPYLLSSGNEMSFSVGWISIAWTARHKTTKKYHLFISFVSFCFFFSVIFLLKSTKKEKMFEKNIWKLWIKKVKCALWILIS